MRLPMKVELPEVEQEEWGDNAPMVTHTDLQRREVKE